jgi:hypothetical protein
MSSMRFNSSSLSITPAAISSTSWTRVQPRAPALPLQQKSPSGFYEQRRRKRSFIDYVGWRMQRHLRSGNEPLKQCWKRGGVAWVQMISP